MSEISCPICYKVLSYRTGFPNIIGCQSHCWIGVNDQNNITHYKIKDKEAEIIASVRWGYTKFMNNGKLTYETTMYLSPGRALKLRAFL